MRVAGRLLRAHVGRRAHGESGTRQRIPGRDDRLRDPEVGDVGLVALEQDVLRLDVPVHHVVRVRERQRIRDLARDRQHVGQRQLLLADEPLAERLARDVGHDEVEGVSGLAGVVERQNVRVVEPAGDGDLAQEPLGTERGGEVGPEHLQGDRPVLPGVVAEVHRGPPAAPELALDRVPAGERRLQLRKGVQHRHRLFPRGRALQ